LNVTSRTKKWNSLDRHLDTLRKKYAWAIPDKKSLFILNYFSPLVEIGAGRGYWAMLLQNIGCDIVPYDKFTSKQKKQDKNHNWTFIRNGGPEVLLDAEMTEKTCSFVIPMKMNLWRSHV